jgi:hypothetical protein
MNDAAKFLNILTALTVIVPVTVPVDEMTTDDVGDARDTWDFYFAATSGTTFYPGDERALRVW